MNEDAGDRTVGYGQDRSFPVLHLKIMRGIIQFEAFRCMDFNAIIGTVLQRQKYPAIFIGGHSVYQRVIHPADLKGGIGQTLCLFIRIHLDDLHTADGIIVKRQRLRVFGINGHGLHLSGRINGISINCLGLFYHNCPGDAGDTDLTIGICGVKAQA